MRFTRFPKAIRETVTPQRLRAAELNVAAQREKFALFPELMEDRSGQERAEKICEARYESWKEWRVKTAQSWRAARRRLFSLPDGPRRAVLRYWRECPLPGSPEYLATVVHQAEQGKCFWHEMAEKRRFRRRVAEMRRLGIDPLTGKPSKVA